MANPSTDYSHSEFKTRKINLPIANVKKMWPSSRHSEIKGGSQEMALVN